jgi:hypothetical protein
MASSHLTSHCQRLVLGRAGLPSEPDRGSVQTDNPEQSTDNNAGEATTTDVAQGRIRGRVWLDQDRDGQWAGRPSPRTQTRTCGRRSHRAAAIGLVMVLDAPWVARAVTSTDRWLIRGLLGLPPAEGDNRRVLAVLRFLGP